MNNDDDNNNRQGASFASLPYLFHQQQLQQPHQQQLPMSMQLEQGNPAPNFLPSSVKALRVYPPAYYYDSAAAAAVASSSSGAGDNSSRVSNDSHNKHNPQMYPASSGTGTTSQMTSAATSTTSFTGSSSSTDVNPSQDSTATTARIMAPANWFQQSQGAQQNAHHQQLAALVQQYQASTSMASAQSAPAAIGTGTTSSMAVDDDDDDGDPNHSSCSSLADSSWKGEDKPDEANDEDEWERSFVGTSAMVSHPPPSSSQCSWPSGASQSSIEEQKRRMDQLIVKYGQSLPTAEQLTQIIMSMSHEDDEIFGGSSSSAAYGSER